MAQIQLNPPGQIHGWFSFISCVQSWVKPTGKISGPGWDTSLSGHNFLHIYISTEALYCHSVSFPSIARHLMKYLRQVMSLLCWCFHALCAGLVIIRINILISNVFWSSLMGFYSTGSHPFLPISFILILTVPILLIFVFQWVINSFQNEII